MRPASGRRPARLLAALGACLLAVVLGPGCVQAERPPTPADPVAVLSERIPELREEHQIPGVAVAVLRGGRPVWSQGYGSADVAEGTHMTATTPNRAESITKSVVAWGVLRLAQQGRLDLDDPVDDHLETWRFPPSTFATGSITARHLLSHTAGLPLGSIGRHYPPDSDDRPSLRDNLTREAVAVADPGTRHLYSNPGYNVLEVLIEDATREVFEEYMTREVFQPLGMTTASFADGAAAAVGPGYTAAGQPIPAYVYPEKASGGLIASADDIAAFVAAILATDGGPVLGREHLAQLHTPTVATGGIYRFVSESYGLGHFVEELPGGHRAVWHGGQGSGWVTHFHAVPATGDGIVILTNSQRSWPFIAEVLDLWSSSSGLGRVGMGIIVDATGWLRVALVVGYAATLAQAVRLGWSVARGRRGPAPWRNRWPVRLASAVVAVVLLGGVAWTAAQDYLFVTSVFPRESPWLAGLAVLVAVVLAATAALPRAGSEDRRSHVSGAR